MKKEQYLKPESEIIQIEMHGSIVTASTPDPGENETPITPFDDTFVIRYTSNG